MVRVTPAIIILGQNSQAIAQKISALFPGSQIYGLIDRTSDTDITFSKFGETLRELFAAETPIIAICAAGIIIRTLAPMLSDKRAEPPVLAVAEDGSAVVPLLGGLHGVNDLAREIANALGVPPAITTTGDIRFRTALLSPPQGYYLANPDDAKTFISNLLAGAKVSVEGKASWLSESNLPTSQPAPVGAAPTDRIAPTAAIVPKEPRKFNAYLAGATIAALLSAIGGIYGYLKWQETQQRVQQESQQLSQIEALYTASNYEGCISQIPTIATTSTSYASAQNLQEQCQVGLRWKNAKVKNFAQHSDAVGSVAFSPDGLMLASGSKDKTIQIWDLATGKSIRTFPGDSSTVWSVAFDSSGTKLATGTGFWRVMLWDLKTGQATRTLDHTASVWSVALSPDGKLIASGSGDKTTKISDATNGSLIYNLPDHTDFVYSVAFTPDGKSLVSASKDKKITIVDVATGKLLKTIEGHGDQVRSIAITPDGKTIVSGSYDESIKIWNLETGDLMRSIKGHSDDVVSVAISPDGKFIASGSKDKTIKIWDLATGELLNTLTGHTDEVYVVTFSPDGKTIASGSKDNTIKLWLR